MATLQQALPSLLFVLLLLAHACTAATASTLEDSCKRFAGGNQTGHDYDYCVRTLGADPASADVDALGLAVVAVNIARSVVMATEGRIQMVPARWDCLRKCVSEYYITLGRLAMASRYLRGGGDMRKAARTKLAEVLGTTQRCDMAFAEAGQRSPLTTWDRQLDQVVKLAIRITPSS